MSARLISAAQRNRPKDADFFADPVVPHVTLVREAVATLGWGTMTYQCDACSFEWEIWLGLGVEGPRELHKHGLYVPSPFTLSSCPAWPVKPDATNEDRDAFQHLTRCDGRMSHIRFADDREFAATLIPDDRARFVLDPWYEAAQLVIPEPALVYARRWHTEGDDG